jgi:Bacterial Ig-like domain (group 2)
VLIISPAALRQAYMLFTLAFLCALVISSASFAWGADGLTIEPPVIELKGPGEQVQIRVLNIKGEDVTAACVFKSHDGNTVRVSNKGQVISNKAGQTKIEVVNQSLVQLVAVKIAEADAGSKVTFEKDLQPILTRYGCNAIMTLIFMRLLRNHAVGGYFQLRLKTAYY